MTQGNKMLETLKASRDNCSPIYLSDASGKYQGVVTRILIKGDVVRVTLDTTRHEFYLTVR